MTRMQHRSGWAVAAVGALLAIGLVSCTDGLLMTPARGVPVRLTFALSPSAALAGVDADACAKATSAHVQLYQGDNVALDTLLTVSRPCDQPITLALPPSLQLGALQLLVELLASNRTVFQGSASVQISRAQATDAVVTVAPVPAGIVAPDSLRTFTKLGDSTRLSGFLVFATGDTVQGLSPTWTDDGRGIVLLLNGFVRSRDEGSAILTAYYQGGALTHTTRVTVRAVVARVAVTGVADTALMYLGGTRTFAAVASDSNNFVLHRTIVWASSNPKVGSINASGTVQAVGIGQTVITATAEAKADTFTLNVVQAPVARVVVTPNPDTIYPTQTVQLTATTYDAANNVLTGRAVTWTSSNARVAAVNTTGLVTGYAGGTATITATSEGVSGTGTVVVLQPILQVAPAALVDTACYASPGTATAQVTNAGTGTIGGLSVGVTYPFIVGAVYPQFVTGTSLSSTLAPATLTLQLSSSVGVGSYSATVTVSSTTTGTSPVSVPLSYVVQNCIFSNPAPIQSLRPSPGGPGGPFAPAW